MERNIDQNIKIDTKEFLSIDNKHKMVLQFIGNVSWFQLEMFDHTQCKTFALLLKNVVDHLHKNDIFYVNQYVNKEDLEFFTKSEIIQYENDKYFVKTQTDYFIDETVSVLGIQII